MEHENNLMLELPALHRYALVLTRNSYDAEDLVQDTVRRAIEKKAHFEAGTNIRSWAFTIMHNAFCDIRRRRARRPEVSLEASGISGESCGNADSLIEVMDFNRAFAALNPAAREILVLIGVDGLSYEDAAERLGMPVGTVKSRLFRAREALRGLMSAEPRRPAVQAREAVRA